MNGEEIAHELINILSVTLGIQSHLVLAAMRDRASVNNLAMRTVKVIYPNILDIGCFSHTLDIVGEKFNTPTLNTFSSLWISLFSHSPKSKALRKEQTGRAMGTLSKACWWSRWEILNQLSLQFGDVEPFLQNNDVGPAIRPKLLEILADTQKRNLLRTELVAVVDLGEHFYNNASDKKLGPPNLILHNYSW